MLNALLVAGRVAVVHLLEHASRRSHPLVHAPGRNTLHLAEHLSFLPCIMLTADIRPLPSRRCIRLCSNANHHLFPCSHCAGVQGPTLGWQVWLLLVCALQECCGACCVALALHRTLQMQKPRGRARGRCESRGRRVDRDTAAPRKATGERTCVYPVGYRRDRGPTPTPKQITVLTCWMCHSQAEAVGGAQRRQRAEEESQRGPQALPQRRGAPENCEHLRAAILQAARDIPGGAEASLSHPSQLTAERGLQPPGLRFGQAERRGSNSPP